MSQFKDSSHPSQTSPPEILNDQEVVFRLIDSVVSLECCLHYQVLPLELDNNHLTVGMINPKDQNALNFIRPIAASLNYSLEIRSIDPQEHQLILASYLKKSSLVPGNQRNQDHHDISKETMIDEEMSQPSPNSLDSRLTFSEIPGQKPQAPKSSNLHDRPTLIVDSEEKSEDNQPNQPQIISSQPQIHQLQSESPHLQSGATPISFTHLGNAHQETTALPLTSSISEIKSTQESITAPIIESAQESIAAPILELKAEHIQKSIDSLSYLEPEQLWQELLAKILDGGIGRLYLKRDYNYGRIIWSRDGVIQSSLDKVKLDVFEKIIGEIKTLGKQPLSPLKKPKKVAIERIYNQERILLRLEFFVGQSGDEITIQVLRGEALEFYEQRQVEKSVEQAIYFAEKMEKTLRKIRMCSNEQNLGDFSRLETIYRQIERQFQLIQKQNNPQK